MGVDSVAHARQIVGPMSMWNSVKKYYCSGDHEECIYNKPNTADTWWAVDVNSLGFM